MGGGPFVLPSIPLLLVAGTDEPILTFLNPPNLLMLPTVQETLTLAPRTLCCLTWPLPSSKDLLVFINFSMASSHSLKKESHCPSSAQVFHGALISSLASSPRLLLCWLCVSLVFPVLCPLAFPHFLLLGRRLVVNEFLLLISSLLGDCICWFILFWKHPWGSGLVSIFRYLWKTSSSN